MMGLGLSSFSYSCGLSSGKSKNNDTGTKQIIRRKAMLFNSPYDQYKHLNGKLCILLKTHKEERPDFEYSECGDMHSVKFEDGTEINAWPEELTS